MKKTIKVLSSFMAAAVLLAGFALPTFAQTLPVLEDTRTPAKTMPIADDSLTGGKFNIIEEDYNYGIDVTKLIVNIGQPIAVNSVDSDTFKVTAKTYTPEGKQVFPDIDSKDDFYNTTAYDSSNPDGVRWQTSTYVCDKNGNQIKSGTGNYVMINLAHGMYQNGATDNHRNNGCPAAVYDGLYCRYLTMNYTVTQTKTISGVSGTLSFAQNTTVNPSADSWTKSTLGSGSLRSRSYEPAPDGKKHPLIVWLHGAGEGGPDEGMQIVANKLTSLSSADFQPILDNAFVLCPECPSVWMFGDYTAQIQSAIEAYVAKHPDIDTSRIYIGGVSAGGYSAWKVLLSKPSYFAAALIASAAYAPTDAELATVKDKPLWLVYSDNDLTCPPASFSAKTIGQLKALGAKHVHYTEIPDVISDGTRYTGHCAWNYIFDNTATDNSGQTKLNVLNWLPKQTLAGCNDSGAGAPVSTVSPAKNSAPITDSTLTADKFNIVCEDYNYGVDVTKLIVNMGQPIPYNAVNSDTFLVTAKTYTPEKNLSFPDPAWDASNPNGIRWQDEVYVCDANGNKITSGTGNYVMINLAHGMFQTSPLDNHPNNGCRAAVYDGMYLRWLTMNYTVTQQHPISGIDGTATFTQNAVVNPAADCWSKGTVAAAGNMRYRSYEPVADGAKHPLVVWLHGMGEGGTDEGVQIVGNKLTAFSSDEFQPVLDNAYILCPECSGVWMFGNYTQQIQTTVETYVAGHPDIDANRIYIGGVSAGGQGAWKVLLNKPSYYAAALIASAAYAPTAAELNTVKDKPIWLVYSDNDTTCPPANYSGKTVSMLKSINANYHVSEFPDVISDGTRYTGHCSWNYIFDNSAADDTGKTDLHALNWLASQSLASNKAALGNVIQTAKAKVETDYSIVTWNRLAKALADATQVFGDVNATQAQVDDAAEALTTAMNKLAPFGIQDVAGRLSIAAPARDAASITLPAVPAGYSVSISSSSNRFVIGLNGSITPPRSDTTVNLVLKVTKSGSNSKACSSPIKVVVPAKTADKSQLAAEIAKAGNLNAAQYTSASWNAMQAALNHAEIINIWPEATQNDVDLACASLFTAVGCLVPSTNRLALKAEITVAGTINLNYYTKDSGNKLKAALTNAVTVNNDPGATQAQIDAACRSLTDAVLHLTLQLPAPILRYIF